VFHDGKVVVQVDAIGTGFLACLDAKDGKELWRTPRNDLPSWSTPTISR
jgi:outer membrane protein assembly factor BamB